MVQQGLQWLRGPGCFKLGKSPTDVDRAVKSIVQHAYTHTMHYRRLLSEASVCPTDIRTSSDLHLVPVTTREIIGHESWRAILSSQAVESRCRKVLTSGSTGTLLPVYMNRREAYYRRLLLLLAFHKNLPRRLPLRIVEVGPRQKPSSDDLIQKLRLVRVLRLPSLLAPLESVRTIERFRPHILTGAPSCLELLADNWRSVGSSVAGPSLVVSRGEVLGGESRSRLQEAFRCRVVDYYNCEEVGNVGWECPDHPRHLHVNTDACVVEIVDPEGRRVQSGEEGLVVVTNLFARTMPFVRYSLGDRACLVAQRSARCSCGSTSPLMTAPSGRDEDFLVLPDGRKVSPRTIDNIVGHELYAQLGNAESFVRYRLVQESADLVRVEAIIRSSTCSSLEQAIEAKLKHLHPGMRCRLDLVERFPEDASGKVRRVVSRVA